MILGILRSYPWGPWTPGEPGGYPSGMLLQVRRVYEASSRTDGLRVLVDRLWPRGITKAAAQIDHWAKATAPSTEFRRSYRQNPATTVPLPY